jgi:hypothetical protein
VRCVPQLRADALPAPCNGAPPYCTIPTAPQILCVVPLDAVRWPIVLVGGAVACLCLVLNLRRLMDNFEDAKRKSIVLGLAGASQFGLAVAVKMYVFAY